MADFYMLAWLGSTNPDALVKAGTTSALRVDLTDVEHAEDVLYPKLREQLLSDVFFALCCEIRHVFDNKVEKPSKFLLAYYRAYRSYTGPLKDPEQPADRDKFSSDSRGYQDSYAAVREAMRTTDMGKAAVVQDMKHWFQSATWNQSYGGKAWAGIADGWLILHRARTKNAMAVAIDHVYDLQHNTDTVFNKLKRYYDSGTGYKWIKQALDFKAQLKNMRDLLPKCSSAMRRMARPILQAAGVQSVSGAEADSFAQPEPSGPVPAQTSKPEADGQFQWVRTLTGLAGTAHFSDKYAYAFIKGPHMTVELSDPKGPVYKETGTMNGYEKDESGKLWAQNTLDMMVRKHYGQDSQDQPVAVTAE